MPSAKLQIQTSAQLGRRIRARRRELSLNQTEVAELAGCSLSFVHMLEAGKPTVRLNKLLDVANVLGLRLTLTGPYEPEGNGLAE